MKTVLHVTECYAGGVESAINKIASLTPAYNHILLFEGDAAGGASMFAEARRFAATGLWSRARELRRIVREKQPHIVHLHSSWAGVYGRILPSRTPLVYEPHCYKFDDPKLGFIAKRAFKFAESVLSKNHDAVITLSEHETRLARELKNNERVFRVPNSPSVQTLPQNTPSLEGASRRVLMVGRICDQKDPAFFADLARAIRSLKSEISWEFVWVGDGEDTLKNSLEAEGIHVTGWLRGKALVDELDKAHAYAHSASYEGFPVSVLDAAARKIPVFVRPIGAFVGTPLPTFGSPVEMAKGIVGAMTDRDAYVRQQDVSNELIGAMNDDTQQRVLYAIYDDLSEAENPDLTRVGNQ